jgi:voltage-gated potassium channel
MESTTSRDELKSANYEFFILALSILSLINWLSYFIINDNQIERVIVAIDLLLSAIFLLDFLYRLFTARSKRHYFLKQFGWLDLLSSLPLPQAKILRMARVIRAIRLLNEYGLRKIVREFLINRAGSAVYLVFFLIILVLQYGSVAILFAEHDARGANITTASDAIWWVLVTISTVGYGDQYPVTSQGRLIAIFVILLGVALFGVVTGFLANAFDTDDEGGHEQELIVQPGEPVDSLTLLQEIARLRQAHEKANAEFNSHLARLVDRLEQVEQTTSES